MEETQRECEKLEMEIAHHNQVQAAAREETTALKKEANDLKDEVFTAGWHVQELEAEEEKLRLQIVSSPDRRKSEKLFRSKRLEEAKAQCAELSTNIQECKTKTANGKQILKELEETNTMLGELHEHAKKHTDLVRKMDDVRKKIELRKKSLAVKNDDIKEENGLLAGLKNTIDSQRKEHEIRMEAAMDALDHAKKRLLNVERERRHAAARVEAGLVSVKEMQAAIDREQDAAEAQAQAVMEQYRSVESQFLARNESDMGVLRSRIENIDP
jgi:chromosome segregation ATPase